MFGLLRAKKRAGIIHVARFCNQAWATHTCYLAPGHDRWHICFCEGEMGITHDSI